MSKLKKSNFPKMKAMLLAAGKGERMMPLTAKTPKPLLEAGGKPLLSYHIEKLKKAKILDIVINHSYLGQQIEDFYQDGRQLGVSIEWSREEIPLETAGGIINALPKLGESPFIIMNGDVWCDLEVEQIIDSVDLEKLEKGELLAHLVLVTNPEHNTTGDFSIESGRVKNEGEEMYTYAGISLLSPKLFDQARLASNEVIGLAPLLRKAALENRVSGQIYEGDWQDIGTPERLNALRKQLKPSDELSSLNED